MKGYIAIPREIYDSPVVSRNAETIATITYLCMKAAWADFDTYFCGKKTTLKRGQLVTGRKKMADDLGVNEHKLDRILKCFESEHLIEQQTTAHGRLISVLFYDSVSGSEQPNEQQMSNKRATDEQPLSTNKNKINKINKRNIYSTDPEVDKAIKEYIEYRKALEPKKKFTEQALKVLLTKLSTLSTDPATQIKILEQSIEHGWKSVYPLKDTKPTNKFNNIIQHDWDMTKLEEALLSQ